ncbi:methyltransferase family protein [Plasticicumulans lactativorans]|uniref:Methyltransferase family protein n=1 Tax=Plasticicumulans lactativorans TaxID=1133106 RepID=A0A4R2L8D8_9GAMM|nr:class I SAM-dependent methyltransferase [Plasticicumulans lactativorans]TCO80336.1 methyltransferase family protein [Plasticicumulans lactativorans]
MPLIELNTEAVKECPLCGSLEHDQFDRVVDTLMKEINRYLPGGMAQLPVDVENVRHRCRECELIFLGQRFDSTSLSRVYELWYGYAYRRVMADPQHVAERLREFEQHHLRLLETYCAPPGRLLDVGCGSGLFLQLAQTRGWCVSGVELDPDTAAWGRRNGIADIRCGTLAMTLAPDEYFDVVTLFDYLEHTTTPGEDLDSLIAHLAPGGTLMVRVPNANGWQARRMGRNWIAVMSTHLSYFTPEVLSKAASQRGLEILYLRAGNTRSEGDILRHQAAWLRQRLAPRRSAVTGSAAQHQVEEVPQAPLGNLGGAAKRWLYSLWIEQIDHIGGWLGQGNNLTLIARKVKH